MSHYLVELYTPNPAWQALSVEQRQQFINGIQSGMSGLAQWGVELLTLRPAMRCWLVSPPAAGMIILNISMPPQTPVILKSI